MKLSLDWIKDYVKLPANLEISKLMHDLTMSTVEVEGAESLAERYANIVVGLVLEVLPHPNADKLRVCRTDIGGGEVKEIVCGGVNLRNGMKVVVSKPGARVRWHGEGELVEIKNAKLRGVESYGMICSSSEIALFDLFPFEEQATIVDLSAFGAAPGTPLVEALDIDDVILEIDNKSLTNRPDLWGHYGVARELSAIYDLPLASLPTFEAPQSDGGLRIAIDDAERCSRYVGIKIDDVSTKPASFKIQSRIWRVGMRPINAIVDITNYVMLATGQPTHAFDSGNIEGGITVRRAGAGENLLLLNGKALKLDTDDLVIADDKEAVALAGIMGGGKDSILPETVNVVLEIANFNALGTRKTAQRYDLRTEASIRYEKGIDPQRVDLAAGLSAQLFAVEFPEVRFTGYVDNYPRKLHPTEVDVSLAWLAHRMGKQLGNDTVRTMLERLGFRVEISGDALHVVSPTWRSTGDISLPDDIMEEVARLYGYENFETAPITSTFTQAINQRDMDLERRIREYLSLRCGLQEVFTYPWVKGTYLEALGEEAGRMLEIDTPPAPDEKFVRSSLLPNLMAAAAANTRYVDEFAIYELAGVFFNEFEAEYTSLYDEREKLPRQRRHVAGAVVSRASSPESITSLFRRAKGVVEHMARHVHMEHLTFGHSDQSSDSVDMVKPAWADESVWLAIRHGETRVGTLGLLSRKAALACDFKKSAVMAFEIDVDALVPLASRTNRFVHLPEYPQVEYDISMLFDDAVRWAEIEAAVTGKKGPDDLVRSVSFVDEYRGKQVPVGKKSITLRLVIGSDSKTLTSEEIEKNAGVISKRLTKQLGGELRG